MDNSAVDAESFTRLRVTAIVTETPDTISLILDGPPDRVVYKAGQYLTLRVLIDGVELRRCYSMSSSPDTEEELRITVKRDPGGIVSNWLHDTLTAGATIEAAAPRGRFVLTESELPLVAFAGGSGITPVFSLLRTVLASTDRSVRLFYANRDRRSVIFADALRSLADEYGDRLTIAQHFDEDGGVVAPARIRGFLASGAAGEYYICGPAPFMDAVETQILAVGVVPGQVHLEHFRVEPTDLSVGAGEVVTEKVIVEIGRRSATVAYRPGSTLLQVARAAGLKPPSSCETGSCGTCIARVTEGQVRLLNNDVLTEEEVADGYTLTCQSLPLGPTVRVIYE